MPDKDFQTFAKRFPALIHTCGLAQAVVFGMAKGRNAYLEDFTEVLRAGGHPEITSLQELRRQACEQSMVAYLRLSRDAINAASWLKRYVEAIGEGD